MHRQIAHPRHRRRCLNVGHRGRPQDNSIVCWYAPLASCYGACTDGRLEKKQLQKQNYVVNSTHDVVVVRASVCDSSSSATNNACCSSSSNVFDRNADGMPAAGAAVRRLRGISISRPKRAVTHAERCMRLGPAKSVYCSSSDATVRLYARVGNIIIYYDTDGIVSLLLLMLHVRRRERRYCRQALNLTCRQLRSRHPRRRRCLIAQVSEPLKANGERRHDLA